MKANTTSSSVMPSGRSFKSLSRVTRDTVRKWDGSVQLQGPLRAVIFDLGNVVFDFDFARASRAICRIEGIRNETYRQELDQFLGVSDHHAAVEKGVIRFPDFFRNVKLHFDLKRTNSRQFIGAWNSIFTLNHESDAFANALQDAGVITFILSDTNRPHYMYLNRNSRMIRRANERFLSFETGIYKSDGPQIFEKVIDTLNVKYDVPAGSAIFFDDKSAYTARAISLGLPAFTFTNAADARTIVKEVWGWEG